MSSQGLYFKKFYSVCEFYGPAFCWAKCVCAHVLPERHWLLIIKSTTPFAAQLHVSWWFEGPSLFLHSNADHEICWMVFAVEQNRNIRISLCILKEGINYIESLGAKEASLPHTKLYNSLIKVKHTKGLVYTNMNVWVRKKVIMNILFKSYLLTFHFNAAISFPDLKMTSQSEKCNLYS